MEKILIWENLKQIEALRDMHTGTAQALNEALALFTEITGVVISDEGEALKFAENPLNYFYMHDETREGRQKFREVFQATLHKARKKVYAFGKDKRVSSVQINEGNEKLIVWLPELRQFSTSTQELEKLFEPHQKYAEGDQLKKVRMVEGLCDMLNKYEYPGNDEAREAIAEALHLNYENEYSPDYKSINL